jgi:hypothetical protein
MKTENLLRFETKEESNARRRLETLARTPHERFLFFLELVEEMQVFQTPETHPNRLKNNFLIE